MSVFAGCIYMSYATRECRSTGATPQSLPPPAPALFVAFASRAATRRCMLHLLAPSLSLSEASPAPQASDSRQPAQDCLHGQVAHHQGPQVAALRCAYSTHFERNRQPRLEREARPGAEAWLNRGHPGRRARFISNIISTVCSLPKSHKRTNCWCPTSDGPLPSPRR